MEDNKEQDYDFRLMTMVDSVVYARVTERTNQLEESFHYHINAAKREITHDIVRSMAMYTLILALIVVAVGVLVFLGIEASSYTHTG